MGKIQALAVEAWLLSSLPFKVEDLSQTCCPLENIIVRRREM
jgi:hypothetical protein